MPVNPQFRVMGILFLFIFVITACAPVGQPAETPGLKITVLPILDALPMFVAQSEGLFTKHGVNVELIPVASGPERDQIVSAGQADGMINEVLSTIFYNKEEVQVQIVRFARTATPDYPVFHILASAQSGITSVEELKEVQIGISEGTVIEYLTDRMLQAEGFSPDEIQFVAVPKIPDRLALLNSGELDAGMLPEPPATIAELNGAVRILSDSSHPEYGHSTIAFRKSVIDSNPEAVRAYLRALEEAVNLINADLTKWDDLMVEHNLIPEPLKGKFKLTPYVTAGVPSQAQWEDVLEWAQTNGLVSQEVSYSSSVTAAYLP